MPSRPLQKANFLYNDICNYYRGLPVYLIPESYKLSEMAPLLFNVRNLKVTPKLNNGCYADIKDSDDLNTKTVGELAAIEEKYKN